MLGRTCLKIVNHEKWKISRKSLCYAASAGQKEGAEFKVGRSEVIFQERHLFPRRDFQDRKFLDPIRYRAGVFEGFFLIEVSMQCPR